METTDFIIGNQYRNKAWNSSEFILVKNVIASDACATIEGDFYSLGKDPVKKIYIIGISLIADWIEIKKKFNIPEPINILKKTEIKSSNAMERLCRIAEQNSINFSLSKIDTFSSIDSFYQWQFEPSVREAIEKGWINIISAKFYNSLGSVEVFYKVSGGAL